MKKNSDITNISSDADALIKLTSKKADIENLTFSRGNLYKPSVIHCIITTRAVFRHWKIPPASSDNNDPERLREGSLVSREAGGMFQMPNHRKVGNYIVSRSPLQTSSQRSSGRN